MQQHEDLDVTIISEVRKKDKYHDTTACMWNLKIIIIRYKWTYLQKRNRLTDIENKHGYQNGKGAGKN